jgi:hypothetical protein
MPETGNKSEASLDLIDETFDVSQSESYGLSLQIAAESLSFCVFNTVVDKYVVLRHYPFTKRNNLIACCRSVFESDELLRLRYKNFRVMWVSPRVTLVPEHLFDPSEALGFLNFTHGLAPDEQALYQYTTQCCHVFSVPLTLKALVEQYQRNIQWFHHSVPFVEWMAMTAKTVTIFTYGAHMDIVVVLKSKELSFYNTFDIPTACDAVYYLAGVLNLFGMQLSDADIAYAGNLKDTQYAESILPYVNKMYECEPVGTVTYSHYLTEPLRKRFIHLFNLYGCAS